MTTLRVESTQSPRAARAARRGFTIIELLISVIIIAILVAIIIPVLSNRAADARLAAARQDLEAIQTAQQHAAIDTGYFYRLYVLDDVRGGDGISPENAGDVIDGVRDEGLRSTNLFIDTASGIFLNPTTAGDKFTLLSNNETNFNWNGPYVNYAKKVKPEIPLPNGNGENFPAGMPLDPWGYPYLFFTREGLVYEPDGRIESNTYLGQPTKVFDRPTILSLGPNSAPGDGTGTGPEAGFGRGDDIFRQF